MVGGPQPARLAVQRFQEAEHAPPEQAAALYDDARRLLEEAVRINRAHRLVPLALVYIARAFERTGRDASAAETYQRILREYRIDVDAYGQPLVGYDRQQRINIFDEAHLRVAENLVRRFEFDAALQAYQRLTTDPTLAAAEGHTERLLRAWSAVARLHEWHGRTVEAETAWRALAAVEAPGAARDDAQYRALTMAYRASEWSRAAAPMRAFLSQSPDDGAHAVIRLRLLLALADVYEHTGDVRSAAAARVDAARVFRQSGEGPGSQAARLAARVTLHALDERLAILRRRLAPRAAGPGASEALWRSEIARIDALAGEVQRLSSGEPGAGALLRQGEARELLAGRLASPFAVRRERRAALVHYGHAVTVANAEGLPLSTVALALDRLHDEANAPLAAEIFVQTDLPFTVRPAVMNASPPGAIALQSTPIATPGLVTE
jgi:tetratricopeptide (TPR) repeat protein